MIKNYSLKLLIRLPNGVDSAGIVVFIRVVFTLTSSNRDCDSSTKSVSITFVGLAFYLFWLMGFNRNVLLWAPQE